MGGREPTTDHRTETQASPAPPQGAMRLPSLPAGTEWLPPPHPY